MKTIHVTAAELNLWNRQNEDTDKILIGIGLFSCVLCIFFPQLIPTTISWAVGVFCAKKGIFLLPRWLESKWR